MKPSSPFLLVSNNFFPLSLSLSLSDPSSLNHPAAISLPITNLREELDIAKHDLEKLKALSDPDSEQGKELVNNVVNKLIPLTKTVREVIPTEIIRETELRVLPVNESTIAGLDRRVTELQESLASISSRVSSASSLAQSSVRMIALTQKIDNLDSVEVTNGLTVASGGLTISSGNITITEGGLTTKTLTVASGLTLSAGTSTVSNLTVGGNAYLATNASTKIGVGTTTPWGFFSVNPTALGDAPEFVVGSSSATHLVVTNGGRIGVGSTTPAERLTVTGGSFFQAGGDSLTSYTPVELGGTEIGIDVGGNSGLGPHPVVVQGPYAYVGNQPVDGACSAADSTGCEFRIYQIAATTSPRFLGGADIGGIGTAIAVSGNIALVGHDLIAGPELFLYDVSNPTSPILVSSFEAGATVRDIAISGRYAYIGVDSSGNDFQIIDIGDPRNPTRVGVLSMGTNVHSLAVSGRYAYLGLNQGAAEEFKIVDISDPANPTAVGGMVLSASVTAVAAYGPYVFIGKTNGGVTEDFIVYDVSNPTSIATTSAVNLSTIVRSIAVAGRYAYVGLSSVTGDDFRIFDLEDPRAVITIGGFDNGANIAGVAVAGTRAYIGSAARTGDELRVFNLTGIQAQSVLAHSLEAGQAHVQNDLIAFGGLYGNSLNTGPGGISSRGPLFVTAASSTATSSVNTVASFMGGRVGIGTTTPLAKLSVHALALEANTRLFEVASSTATATSTLFLIDNIGNVGIGSTSPTQMLTVAAGVNFSGIANGAGTAYLCTTLATGIISTSTSACNPSSLKYKENIENMTYGLEHIRSLRPVSYDYKPELLVKGRQVGFIAEELYDIIPEVVGLKDGQPDNIDYAKLTSVLTKAVQELDEKLSLLASSTNFESGTNIRITNDTNAWSVDQSSGRVNVGFYGDVNLNGNALINVRKMIGENGRWKIDERGRLTTEEIQTKKLCVGAYCVSEQELEILLRNAGLLEMIKEESANDGASSANNESDLIELSSTNIPITNTEGITSTPQLEQSSSAGQASSVDNIVLPAASWRASPQRELVEGIQNTTATSTTP